MANLNKVLLIGRLTHDPEMRYSSNGTAVTTFSIAISRAFTGANGEKKEDVCFVRVVAWAKLAQTCGEYLFKGRPVFVEGRLQSRSWQAQDGTKRNTIEVVAQNIQFLGKGRSNQESAGAGNEDMENVNLDDLSQGKDEEVPF